MVTQRTGTADQNGGSARGCQGLFESLAAWHSRSRPWQADGQGLCINQPVAQSRAEGALEFPDADTGAAALLLHPPGREIEVAALRLGIEDGQ